MLRVAIGNAIGTVWFNYYVLGRRSSFRWCWSQYCVSVSVTNYEGAYNMWLILESVIIIIHVYFTVPAVQLLENIRLLSSCFVDSIATVDIS